jgi:hypothetical protein
VKRWAGLAIPLLASLLLFNAPAAAQGVATGSLTRDGVPVGVPEGRTAGDKARGIIDRFAFCIVRHHYSQVVKTLALNLAQQYEALPKLMDRDCFFGRNGVQSSGMSEIQLNMGPQTFRGALYKALVQQKAAQARASFGATAAPLPTESGRILELAACVARRDPTASLQMLNAKAGSKQEDAAFESLQPNLGECVGQGVRLKLPAGTFVAFLAEAYYRESVAANAAGAN